MIFFLPLGSWVVGRPARLRTLLERMLVFLSLERYQYVGDPLKLALQVVPLVPEEFSVAALRLFYDISFFIIVTTIGLNIVFGIIVDTFSELRDERVCPN